MTDEEDRPVIVAGVDGSDCSIDAIRWAARQAALTGGELRALIAWALPEIYSYPPRDFHGDARKVLDDAIEQALGKDPQVPVIAEAVEADAAQALIAASRRAQMLVVGSCGRSSTTCLLLGSVSQLAVSYAECTVVVVR